MGNTVMAAAFGLLLVAGVSTDSRAHAAQRVGTRNGVEELAQAETQSTSDNPAGHCSGNLNPGDIRREGVCYKGERTVYRCDANRDCKQAGKEACNDNIDSSPKQSDSDR